MSSKKVNAIAASAFLLCFSFTTAMAQAQASGEYTVDTDWAELPGDGWDGPTTWVAADGEGKIVVMVRTAPYFREFSRDGEFVRAWGDDIEFQNAHSVTFDDNGYMWATDAAKHVVYKYDMDGELQMTLGTSGEAGDNTSTSLFNQPNHVAIADNGDIYVSDGYVNSRIVHFAPDGSFIRVIGGDEGSAEGQLKVPHGVAIDSDGRVLVNDSDNQRIAVFNADGSFAETWPFPSRGGIVVTGDDLVFVSDVNAGAVNVLQNGELIDTVSVDARPHGLGVDSDGAIYVSDSIGRKVMKITKK